MISFAETTVGCMDAERNRSPSRRRVLHMGSYRGEEPVHGGIRIHAPDPVIFSQRKLYIA